MARVQTQNEHIGYILEGVVNDALQMLKDQGEFKDFHSNVDMGHNGDLDHIIDLHDGSHLHIEDMNWKTKWKNNERQTRIRKLPWRLSKSRKKFGIVHKLILITTSNLDARVEWLEKKQIEPILIGEQLTDSTLSCELIRLTAMIRERVRLSIEDITLYTQYRDFCSLKV